MQIAPPTPADRLAALIVRLVFAVFARRVGAHLGFVPVPLVTLISDRLRQVSQRFRRLADRLQAGWVYKPRQASPRTPTEPPADRPPRQPADRPDTSLAKFVEQVRLIPGQDMEAIKLEFQHLLADAEMQAVMKAAPGPAWRILRPLCRMIGSPRPDILAPPPQPARPKATKAPKVPRVRKPRFEWLAEREYSFTAHWPRGIPGKPRTT